MKSDEDRIEKLETFVYEKTNDYNGEAIARALCEIARQLARLADAYEEAHK